MFLPSRPTTRAMETQTDFAEPCSLSARDALQVVFHNRPDDLFSKEAVRLLIESVVPRMKQIVEYTGNVMDYVKKNSIHISPTEYEPEYASVRKDAVSAFTRSRMTVQELEAIIAQVTKNTCSSLARACIFEHLGEYYSDDEAVLAAGSVDGHP